MAEETGTPANALQLATDLTVAWLNNPNNRVMPDDVPVFLKTMHSTLNDLSNGAPAEMAPIESEYEPAVPPRTSVKKDRIISLIDGKGYKTLRRHLSTHGLTPEQYRERYGLKPDYPMVAPDYSAARREMAKKIGLGRVAEPRKAAAGSAPTKGRKARSAPKTTRGRRPPQE